MSKNERDPQADLALCEAATPGPWESVSGYSVREPEDERGYGPIIANMDCKEHSVEQMVHNACFICESREALPWYIRAYLAQREEIERLKREYAEEIDEFNAGYQAAKDGLPESAEPERCPHDVWRCGYAWGAFEGLKKDIKELQEDYHKEIDTNQLLREEVDRLALVAQGAGEDCDKCGWRMRFPGEPCRCELDLEVERLRAENERLREQSEESALARLRAWVQGDSTYYRHADLSVEGRKDDAGEPSMCLDISWHGGKLSVWNTPLKREMPDTIGIGTEDKPASFGEMVEAALARWAELYGNQ